MLKVEKVSATVLKVRVNKNKSFFLASDVHYDSPYCDRDLLLKHLKLVQDNDAMYIHVGDWFDAMQGKYDPRKSYDDLRPEYKTDAYFDEIVEDSVEFLKPFRKNLLMFGYGNHETTVKKRLGTDLIQRLVYGLRTQDSPVVAGGYGGWIKFLMENCNIRGSKNYYYHHGRGAGAEVTRGAIDTNRQAVYLPDADVIHNGHNHHAYMIPIARRRLSAVCEVYQDIQFHVRTPGYKREVTIREDGIGYANERHPAPTTSGGAWMNLYWERRKPQVRLTMEIQ